MSPDCEIYAVFCYKYTVRAKPGLVLGQQHKARSLPNGDDDVVTRYRTWFCPYCIYVAKHCIYLTSWAHSDDAAVECLLNDRRYMADHNWVILPSFFAISDDFQFARFPVGRCAAVLWEQFRQSGSAA